MKKKSWIILLFFYLLITACEDTRYTGPSTSEDLVSASIQFSVDDVLSGYNREIVDHVDNLLSSDTVAVMTRNASRSVLHRRAVIYQFSENGDLYYKSEPFSIDLSYGTPSAIQTNLRPGTNMTVSLFVALADSQLPDIRSESEIQELPVSYSSLLKEDAMPFFSTQRNVNIQNNTQHTLKTFALERLCSKLIVEYEIDPGSGFYLREIRVVNVPENAYYHPRDQHAETGYISGSEYVSASGGTFTCYIPENNQGIVSGIQSPEQKNIRNAPLNATYVELTGFFRDKKVTFRIFPGANATTDFNLNRNRWYRIFLRITDVYLEDLRVEYSESDQFIIYLADEPTRDYSRVKNILLNNQLWINDFTIEGTKLTLNYTSSPGSVLNEIYFCDLNGADLFGGKVNYTFSAYNVLYFSSMLEAQGYGSASHPYLIYEARQLKNINRLCNAGFSSRRFIQQDHIDLSVTDKNKWQPLGSASAPFDGIYDGNGYSIRNLTINTNSTGDNNKLIPYAGLFGYVQNSVLRNIHLREGYIGCKALCMGAVAGKISGTILDECSSTLKIEQFQRSNAGGLVGESEFSLLRNSYNRCTKEMTAWYSETNHTGGITGLSGHSKVINVYSIQPVWINQSNGLGAVIGKQTDNSIAQYYFAEQYKTSGDKTIGYPASTDGLMSSSYLKSSAFTDRLNSYVQPDGSYGKWQFQSGNYPKLRSERP